jgi:hypothetical protein
MRLSAHSAQGIKAKRPQSLPIRTTLYNLIAAISAEVQPEPPSIAGRERLI